MSKTVKIRAFFAWQSDLPKKTNTTAIKNSLEKISTELRNQNIELYIDLATRDSAGSPNIPDSIRDKIEKADIFIGDVSTINNGLVMKALSILGYKQRKVPNPNVTFELGYAASEVGWDRMILLFNDCYGEVGDLPFDFDRHRLMRYFLSSQSQVSDRKALVSSLRSGIVEIVKANPLKPAQKRGMNPAQLRRERDVKNLTWLLQTIHIPTLDEFIESIPAKFSDMIFFFFEEFKTITDNNLFHISDEKLLAVIRNLRDSWDSALSHENFYEHDKLTGYFYFHQPFGRAFTDVEEQSLKDIKLARKEMFKWLKQLQEIVRRDYVEIDPVVLSQEAIKSYRLFHEDLGDSS
ncbi:hypothetical protein KBC79_04470 [Candidatus Woesebacteria bacterium]|nr:hypothetical protein [Candidatus Woesebacteria bacterium]